MHKILANTSFLGKDIYYLTDCHSTNEFAMSLFKAGLVKEGTIVTCENQTKGKGQRGNVWYSEPGKNLIFSIILTPNFLNISHQFSLNMALSCGIHEALKAYIGEIRIKWPNDIMVVNKGKLGGVLIENVFGSKRWELSIVGIGINVNQAKFDLPKATSMFRLLNQLQKREELFIHLVTILEKWYLKLKESQLENIRSYYLENLFCINEWARFDDGEEFYGKIIGVEDQGELIVEKQNGKVQSYQLKEIRFL